MDQMQGQGSACFSTERFSETFIRRRIAQEQALRYTHSGAQMGVSSLPARGAGAVVGTTWRNY